MSLTSRVRRRWTESEDQILRSETDYQSNQGILKDWNRIAAKLPGRTNKDCRKRWSKVCEHVKKGAWDAAEDERLQNAVQLYGPRWTQVARMVGTRHGDQCAKRWQHSLDPNVDHSQWTTEDDERLMAAVKKFGRNWRTIVEKEFLARSNTELKNRYTILIGRRKRASERSTPISPGASMDLDNESDSDDNDLDGLLEGYDSFPRDSPPSDVFTTLTGPSPLITTPEAPLEMVFDPSIDLSLEGIPNCLSPILTAEELDRSFSAVSATVFDPTTFFDESCASGMILPPPQPPPVLPATSSAMPISGPAMPAGSSRTTTTTTTVDEVPFADRQAPWRTTLTLENVQPETLNSVMQIIIQSRTKVTMEMHQ